MFKNDLTTINFFFVRVNYLLFILFFQRNAEKNFPVINLKTSRFLQCIVQFLNRFQILTRHVIFLIKSDEKNIFASVNDNKFMLRKEFRAFLVPNLKD